MPGKIRHPELNDPDWLSENAHRTTTSIARQFGVDPSLVANRYRRYGIERRAHPRVKPRRYPALYDPAALAGKTVDQVAAQTGAARFTVLAAFRRHGITPPVTAPTGRRRGKGIPPPRYPQLADYAWLEANAHRPHVELAAEIGGSAQAVREAMQRHGLAHRRPRKTVAESSPA